MRCSRFLQLRKAVITEDIGIERDTQRLSYTSAKLRNLESLMLAAIYIWTAVFQSVDRGGRSIVGFLTDKMCMGTLVSKKMGLTPHHFDTCFAGKNLHQADD